MRAQLSSGGKRVIIAANALFPYLMVLSITAALASDVSSAAAFLAERILWMPVVMGIWYLIALLGAVLFLRSARGARERARSALLIKTIQIPAYIAIFLFSLTGVLFIQLLLLTAVMFVFDVMTIALSGTMGLFAAFSARREGILTTKAMWILGLLQYIWCVDVVCALILWRKTKQSKTIPARADADAGTVSL
ncbi:MAG: hypothetical protein IKE30_02495 [Clostridia bacterium]|nr:hypothetical protein [Clostridia bacterium]